MTTDTRTLIEHSFCDNCGRAIDNREFQGETKWRHTLPNDYAAGPYIQGTLLGLWMLDTSGHDAWPKVAALIEGGVV